MTPSSNQRMNTSPEVPGPPKLVFLTLVKGRNQSMRPPSSYQKPSGSCTEAAYMASYFGPSIWARRAHSGDTG